MEALTEAGFYGKITVSLKSNHGGNDKVEERRNISRVDYAAKGVIVVCDTGDKYFVDTKNVSPLGMGIIAPSDLPDIVGKDIIIVASTLIMYADVNRQEKNADGTYTVGINAKQFTPDVLQYLFKHIAK